MCKIVLDAQGNPTGELICAPDESPFSTMQCFYIGESCNADPCVLPPGTTDRDRDGYDSSVDCDDDDFDINPGATEICDDGINNDCQNGEDCDDSACSIDPGCQPEEDPCDCPPGYECVFGLCSDMSPIVIDTMGNGFNLTDALGGVDFDFNADGVRTRLSWTSLNSDDAWLVLDRNGNGLIDNGMELFGNITPQPSPPAGKEKNGFLALAEYDRPSNGGNGDGRINQNDAIFSSLRLWQDANHNGISELTELKRLRQLGLARMDLAYRESRRRDQHGNWFKYRAKVRDTHGAQLGRWAWDVILLPAP